MNHENPQPLVSVIVPVYNVEGYLARCLDSIVNQTYHNLEIILINDGSTDRSGEICSQYAQRDARIRLFTQENQGLSVARNVGLDRMRGEYIVFVDSDDYISTYFVEILLGKLLEFCVPIVRCDACVVAEENDDAALDPAAVDMPIYAKRVNRELALDPNKTSGSVCGAIFRKKIFDGLRFKEGKTSEDIWIAHYVYMRIDEMCHVNLKMYAYRQRKNSTSNKDGIKVGSFDYTEAFLDRLIYFKEQGIEQHIPALCKIILESYTYLPEYPSRDELRKNLKELEQKLYGITGKRYFSLKYTLFKAAPGPYQFVRRIYKRAQSAMGR